MAQQKTVTKPRMATNGSIKDRVHSSILQGGSPKLHCRWVRVESSHRENSNQKSDKGRETDIERNKVR